MSNMNESKSPEPNKIDRIIHEPARLKIFTCLDPVDNADFIFLLHETGLSKGNLSSHLSKLELAGYVEIEKTFIGKIPRTLISLSKKGRKSFQDYKNAIVQILELK